MLPLLRNSVLALVVAAVPLVAQNAPAKSAHAVQRRAKATAKHQRSGKLAAPTTKHQRSGKQPAAPTAVAQPITQMTPEQLPSSPPQVTYQNGLLTIDSRNSTLQDILAAVRRQTGAQIDIPPGAPAERVAAHLGPAAPRDVLSSLLVGSRFGYIILGAPDRPDAVQKVVLTLLPAGGSAAAPAPAAAAMGRPQQPPPPPVESSPDEEEPDVVERNSMPPDQPAPPSMEAPAQPGVAQPGQPSPFFPGGQAPPQVAPNQQQPGSPQAAPTPPQVKTPDQLLQELQRLRNQQQQIQQQQQQNQQNQQPPPE